MSKKDEAEKWKKGTEPGKKQTSPKDDKRKEEREKPKQP